MEMKKELGSIDRGGQVLALYPNPFTQPPLPCILPIPAPSTLSLDGLFPIPNNTLHHTIPPHPYLTTTTPDTTTITDHISDIILTLIGIGCISIICYLAYCLEHVWGG